MAKLVEYAPCVVNEVRKAGVINQTALTEVVWGSSGRGNTTLTQVLFPFCVSKGWIRKTLRGRSILFTLTTKGQEYLDKPETVQQLRNFGELCEEGTHGQ